MDDPFALFAQWMDAARATEPNDPDAMALATVDAAGRPSVRMVLMRRHGPDGFGFFTNLDSRKGHEAREQRQGALCIHWKTLRKQVRAEGELVPASDADSDAYFSSRGRLSQLGAWASLQSQPLPERAQLDQRFADAEQRFDGEPVPRPPYWGGFRLIPRMIEFWEDGANRLHQRRVFTRETPEARWTEGLLYP